MSRPDEGELSLFVHLKVGVAGTIDLDAHLKRGNHLSEDQRHRLPHLRALLIDLLARMEEPDISPLPDVTFGYSMPDKEASER